MFTCHSLICSSGEFGLWTLRSFFINLSTLKRLSGDIIDAELEEISITALLTPGLVLLTKPYILAKFWLD